MRKKYPKIHNLIGSTYQVVDENDKKVLFQGDLHQCTAYRENLIFDQLTPEQLERRNSSEIVFDD